MKKELSSQTLNYIIAPLWVRKQYRPLHMIMEERPVQVLKHPLANYSLVLFPRISSPPSSRV